MLDSNFRIPGFLLSVSEELVEEKVMLVLAQQSPLTLQEITGFLEIEFKTSCDCSFVSQAVEELVAEGILQQNKNVYSVSVEWIGLFKEFTNSLLACTEIV